MKPELDADSWVLVLTGAGVSAESGVPTFRGAGGLWNNRRFEELASPQGFMENPALVWEFYSERRSKAKTVHPNPGHHALAALEKRLGDRFLLATQNVDGLHRRAGNRNVVELHGNLFTSRCWDCDRAPFTDETVYEAGTIPKCDQCGGKLRPHIVWFGEMLNPADLRRVNDFMVAASRHRFVFVAAGTSGVVYPAAGMVDLAREARADTWLVNADPADNGSRFHHFVQGKSGEVLPRWFNVEPER
ncbi:MAG: SIR2 family NAD-dependent protein deacylase [Myxococcaceae bacterium]